MVLEACPSGPSKKTEEKINSQIEVINENSFNYVLMGAEGDWDFRISDLSKTLMELIFKPCGEFR